MSVPLRTSSAAGRHSEGRAFTERQRRLLVDLERIVLAEGFRDLTVASMAARLACSRRTLYEVAPSKEELVLLVIDRVLSRVAVAGVEAMAHEATARGRLRAFLTTGLGELRGLSLEFADDAAADPPAQALLEEHLRLAARRTERIVAEGMADGEFTAVNAILFAEVVWACSERLLDPAVLRRCGLGFAEAQAEFLDFVVRGLAP